MADSLETIAYFLFVTQIFFCTMYGVLVWDWIVSLTREYRLIWKSDWSSIKILYLFCRYWPLVVVPWVLFCFASDHSWETCQKIYKSPVALSTFNQMGAEAVLVVRTWAFCGRKRWMLIGMCTTLAGVLGYQLFAVTAEMVVLPFVKPPFQQGPCLPVSRPHSAHILGFFVAPLLFDSILTGITLVQLARMPRAIGRSSNSILHTFIREGLAYFVLISVSNLINGIFYLQPRVAISAINIPLSIMFPDILACRMVLDLRSRGSGYSSHEPSNAISGNTQGREIITFGKGTGRTRGRGATVDTMMTTAVELDDMNSTTVTGSPIIKDDADLVEQGIVQYVLPQGSPTSKSSKGTGVGGIRIDVEKTVEHQ